MTGEWTRPPIRCPKCRAQLLVETSDKGPPLLYCSHAGCDYGVSDDICAEGTLYRCSLCSARLTELGVRGHDCPDRPDGAYTARFDPIREDADA